jgi:hypothetical protein
VLREYEQDLPADLKKVLAAIARALGEQPITPERLELIVNQLATTALPGHRISIEHQPRPPKGARPRPKAIYFLSIFGRRIDGKWSFSPGQFHDLLRQSSS